MMAMTTAAREAARLLGQRIREGRLERRWSQANLADRLGVTRVTVRKIETGDPTVKLGTVFEAAVLVGVPLFSEDPARRGAEVARVSGRLALLPSRARPKVSVDDDF